MKPHSKKKVILVGFPNPIKLKSKKFVIETLYNRARKNPFLANSSYEEYLDFLLKQIDILGNSDTNIDRNSSTLEADIYDSLKKMNWLKVINAFVVGIIEATNIGV
jgi:flavin-binding protein dodecin|tara:strand:- start:374 stop:691 length:318 start_codon:yes stop_codon:yes gene_type:complete